MRLNYFFPQKNTLCKCLLILLPFSAMTSCSDKEGINVDFIDQEMSFSVPTDGLQFVNNSPAVNKAEGNAIHTRENIEGSDFTLHTIVEPYELCSLPASRAAVSTLDGLKETGFKLTAIVTENDSQKKHLYMKDTDVNHTGSNNWSYGPLRYWPDITRYLTEFFAFRPDDFDSAVYEGDNMLPTCKYTVPVDPTAQKDIITAYNNQNDLKTVELNFKHRMTSVRIKTKNIDRPIIRIEFTGIYDDGSFDLNSMQWKDVKFSETNPNGEFKYRFVGSQLLGESSGNTEAYVPDDNGSEYYFMMLPQNLGASGRNARVKVLFDNGTIITAQLKTNWEPGKAVTYLFTYNEVTCQWLDDSNCYLINPISTSNRKEVNLFAIPISFRVNTFWQNEGPSKTKPLVPGTKYVAEVIWQDVDHRMISFTNRDGINSYDTFSATVHDGGGDDEHIYFKLSDPSFTGTTNVVVGVRRDGESTYLWSWHLWLSDYYPIPASVYKLTSAARVPVVNGIIERYDDPNNAPQVWGSTQYRYRYLMDRNIGAAGPSDGSNSTTYEKSFGVYYQFGRKDPFPPNGKLYRMESDGSIKELGELTETDATLIAPAEGNKKIPYDGVEDWPVVKTVQFPLEFVTSTAYNSDKTKGGNWRNPSWYPAGASVGSKSFYDPCPPGWRLPNGNIFNVFSNNQTFSYYGITVSPDSKLTDGDVRIGIRFRISTTDPALTTDMLLWSRRYFDDGIEKRSRDNYNSFLYRSEYFNIFQIYNFDVGTVNLYNNSDHACYGAQVRAIHE